jgi:hypothetical protein
VAAAAKRREPPLPLLPTTPLACAPKARWKAEAMEAMSASRSRSLSGRGIWLGFL